MAIHGPTKPPLSEYPWMPINEPSKDGHLAYSPWSGHPWIPHALAIPVCGPSTDGCLAYPLCQSIRGCRSYYAHSWTIYSYSCGMLLWTHAGRALAVPLQSSCSSAISVLSITALIDPQRNSSLWTHYTWPSDCNIPSFCLCWIQSRSWLCQDISSSTFQLGLLAQGQWSVYV